MAKNGTGNQTKKRGKGNPDMNVRAFETMLIATGQMEKLVSEKPTKKAGVSLRSHAKKS